MSHYPHHINVRLTKEQYDVIKPNPSVAIRKMIDEYIKKVRKNKT